jgi:CheY-like chemotaxis protein
VPKVNVLKKAKECRCGHGLFILKRRMEEIAEARNVEDVRRLLWEIIDIDVKMSKGEADCSQVCMGEGRDESECAPPVAAVDAGAVPVKGQVLAVAYHADDEACLKDALRLEGYECGFVDSMEMAIKRIVSDTSYFATICDYRLPDGTIWKFRGKLEDMGVEIPLIATTACDAKSRLEQLRNIDPSIHQLRKPFLADRVRSAFVSQG